MTRIARDAADRIDRWFFAPTPIYPLVLARIILGAVLFFCYLGRLPEVQLLYGPHGVAGPDWIDPDYLAGRPLKAALEAVMAMVPPPSEGMIWLIYSVELLAALCFAVGFQTRTAGVIALAIHVLFASIRLPFGYWGWAQHVQPLILYVLFSKAGRFVSVDAWLAKRAGKRTPADADWVDAAWPMRLLQVHTCTMYLVSGGERLDDAGWIQGRAIWMAMTNIAYSKWAYNWHDLRDILWLGSWGAFIMEPLAPFLLWIKTVGVWIAYMLLAMHVALELLTNVGWWNFVMIAGVLCFIPTAHTRAIVARLPGGPPILRK